MERINIRLSFCITCKNRFHQIKKTLPKNLADNYDDRDKIEFVLVDFGSTDGLENWITENFSKEIETGYLKYYYTEELKKWHSSVAKNTAHILADHEILVNLDCDNYTGKRGGMFVLENMIRYGYKYTVIHQFSNQFGDGSCGRIAVDRENFLQVGGYDEGLEPVGYQDIDLILRLTLAHSNYIHLANCRYNRAIPNKKGEGVFDEDIEKSWLKMNYRNHCKSISNICSGKIIANSDKCQIGVIDNIYMLKCEEEEEKHLTK